MTMTWECMHGYPLADGCPMPDCPDRAVFPVESARRSFTLGQCDSAAATVWLHVERPSGGRGFSVWLRILRLTVGVQVSLCGRGEWSVYSFAHGRLRTWWQIELGPGVLPF